MAKPFATVLESATSLTNKTGSWRTFAPAYTDKLPPCNLACPAGENVQKWLAYAQEGKMHEAWKVMIENNPFPAIMGKVCYHTCEIACNRSQFDGAVNINLIERSVGDIAISEGWSFNRVEKSSGKKILIIGAGPSGLSAAYFLRQQGHDVTIYEAHLKAGGMMRYGVPRYRLPYAILDAEINRLVDLGIKIECNHSVSNISDVSSNFDAVYISTGASLARKRDLNIKDDSNVIDAIDLFKKVEDSPSEVKGLGNKVFVYGGGNTAIDAARTSLRLGANDVTIIYRRNFEDMSAHDEEIQEAIAEGVKIMSLSSITMIDGKNVTINKILHDKEADSVVASDEFNVLEADHIIFAIGQAVDDSIFEDVNGIVISEKGSVEIDANMMTGANGIFAGGDVIKGKRTVTHAIGYGKKAAKCINAYLNGESVVHNKKHDVAIFKTLNTAYYQKNPKIDVEKPVDISFNEPNISLEERGIISESERCFSCGNCFHCDNCYGFCPDNAIIKHEDGTLEINYDYCKGCGICASECPCGCIKMSTEE